jgi:hypothetical protein
LRAPGAWSLEPNAKLNGWKRRELRGTTKPRTDDALALQVPRIQHVAASGIGGSEAHNVSAGLGIGCLRRASAKWQLRVTQNGRKPAVGGRAADLPSAPELASHVGTYQFIVVAEGQLPT